MNQRRRSYLLMVMCMCWSISAVGAESSPLEIVPVAQEPRHHLATENQYVRIFDVRIPAGDTSLYHRHGRDSIYVTISGTTSLTTQEFGEPAKPLLIRPGDVAFGNHAASPFTHRVANASPEEFHVVDIELVADQTASTTPLATLPPRFQPLLENHRVRISRVSLNAGEDADGRATLHVPGLFIAIIGTRLAFVSASGLPFASDATPGRFYINDSAPTQIRNDGDGPLELISIEIK